MLALQTWGSLPRTSIPSTQTWDVRQPLQYILHSFNSQSIFQVENEYRQNLIRKSVFFNRKKKMVPTCTNSIWTDMLGMAFYRLMFSYVIKPRSHSKVKVPFILALRLCRKENEVNHLHNTLEFGFRIFKPHFQERQTQFQIPLSNSPPCASWQGWEKKISKLDKIIT